MPDELPVHFETSFLVEHHQRDRTLSGRLPARSPDGACFPALRTSGLWATLPPEDFKNLILMLTYLSPNGHCQPTAQRPGRSHAGLAGQSPQPHAAPRAAGVAGQAPGDGTAPAR